MPINLAKIRMIANNTLRIGGNIFNIAFSISRGSVIFSVTILTKILFSS